MLVNVGTGPNTTFLGIATIADSNLIPSSQVLPTSIPIKLIKTAYVIPGLEHKASPALANGQLRIWPQAQLVKYTSNPLATNISQTSNAGNSNKLSTISEIPLNVNEDRV